VASVFQGFEGTYIGLSPTDESNTYFGELEVTIGVDRITFKHATGLTITEDSIPVSIFDIMTQDEIVALFENKPPDIRRYQGFRSVYFKILFLSHPQDVPACCFLGMLMEHLGPTLLFNAEQVEKGLFEQYLTQFEVENEKIGMTPRLSAHGKAPGTTPHPNTMELPNDTSES